MANRDFAGTLKTLGGRIRVIMFNVFVSGTNATIVDKNFQPLIHPLVASVEHLSAGKYKIVLRDSYLAPVLFGAHYLALDDNVDLYAQAGTPSNFSTPNPVELIIRLKTGSVNTDPGGSGGALSVILVAEDSGAYPA